MIVGSTIYTGSCCGLFNGTGSCCGNVQGFLWI